MKQKSSSVLIILGGALAVGGCLAGLFVSGAVALFLVGRSPAPTIATPTLLARNTPQPTWTPTATRPPATATNTRTVTLTPSPTPEPTATFTQTPTPTATTPPPPPTATPSPTQPPPPTNTPLPTAPPTPDFSFTVAESGQFPTSHENFDVFIAITDANNTPLGGYRVLASHSSGQQVESAVSADRWTENSGAMHYKAGNIKLQVLNSPGGVWTLDLLDGAGTPVAPSIQFPFDPDNPTWYFLLYRRQN